MDATYDIYFAYLDALKKSGETNMFGAMPYLARDFGIKQQEAQRVLIEWMQTYNDRHPEEG